jgi:phage tail sheath protein FI
MTRPIEGVGTAVAAFVGLADAGPIDSPETFDGWGSYEDEYGGRTGSGAMGHQVWDFFENGGASAVVVRVADAGLEAVRAGLAALDQVDLVNLLLLPSESAELPDAHAIVAEAVMFCERRRAMLLVDPPSSWTSATAIEAALVGGVAAAVGTASPNAASYVPRLRRSDPVTGGATRVDPASGAVAGVFARTDATEGVWTAPAGLDAELRGAGGLDVALSDAATRRINARGVSTLRTFPGRGPVVWGARTLAGADTASSEWKYVPVRRTALFLEESIERGLRWTASEPNDELLWQEVRESVGTFLHDLFRAGAFQGSTPRDAYFVRCDRDTVTQHDLEAGEFTVLIGFAPMRPAEFVVLQIRGRALPTT